MATFMTNESGIEKGVSVAFGVLVFAIGLANLFLVHPVPGVVFLLLSSLFLPQTNAYLKRNVGFSMPFAVRIMLGIVIIWFTLGVSDLGDMIDDWAIGSV